MRRSRRRAAAAALLPTLVLVSTSCSGGDGESAPKPQESSTPSSSPTSESPSVTPKPKPSPSPLSRYEDEPTVVVAREFAARSARAVNRKQRDLGPTRQLLTEGGREKIPPLFAEDIDRDLVFPGPFPFTPVGVEVSGSSALIPICGQLEGFALSRATKLPGSKRQIAPGEFVLRKIDGKWKVENMRYRDGSCRDVSVKGVGW